MMKRLIILSFMVALLLPWATHAQDTLIVADGTATSNYIPVYGLWADYYTRSQFVYPATMLADMTPGSEISSLTFYSSTANQNWGAATFDVKLGEVADTTLSSYLTYDATTVYSGAVTISNNQMVITFTTPYIYMGGNLLVEFFQTAKGTFHGEPFYGVTASGASASGYSSTAPTAASYNQRNFLAKMGIEYIAGSGIVCHRPSNVVISDITSDSATLTWSSRAEHSGYTIMYHTSNFDPDTSTDAAIVTTTDTTYLFTNLDPTTTYYVKIQASCTNGGLSAWTSADPFRTLCADDGCDLVINMTDSYGDGWNGASIDGFVDGVATFSATVSYDSSNTYTHNMCGTDNVELKWHSGNFDSETSFSVTVDGEVIVSNASGSSLSTGQTIINIPGCPSCHAPINMTISGITDYGATISWTAAGEESQWAISVNGDDWETTYDTTYTFSTLESNTTYNVVVKAVCGTDDSSYALTGSFRTACGDYTSVPFFEDFEGMTTMAGPNCWTVLGGMVYVRANSSYSTFSHSGSCYLDFRGNITQDSVQLVALPQMSQPANELQVRFWTRPDSFTSNYCGTFSVGYMVDNDPDSIVILTTWSYDDFSAYEEVEVPMLGAPDDARIVLRHNGNHYWFVDDVVVEPIPECARPTQISVTNISATDADIFISGTDDSEYRLYWTDGTTTDSTDFTGNTYNITNLTANTTYTVSAVTICTDGSVTVPVTVNMHTFAGEPISVFPYTCGFEIDEEGNNEASDWVIDNGTQTNCWYIGNVINHGGTSSLFISNNGLDNIYTTSNSTSNVVAYALFMLDSTEYEFSFDWRCNGESCCDYLKVALVPASAEVTAGANSFPSGSHQFGDKHNQRTSWQTATYSYHVPDAGLYKLVFLWHNDNLLGSNPPAAVDNISIEQLSCPSPVSFVLDSVSSTEASFHWTAGGEETEWEVSVNGSTTVVSTNSMTVNGLSSNTDYLLSIRAICDSGDTSNVALTGSFRTLCGTITVLPWTEDFNSMSATSSATTIHCWDYIGTGGYINISSITTYSHTGNCLRFYPNGSSSTDHILVLPEFDTVISSLEMTFWTRPESDTYSGSLSVGYVTDSGAFVETFNIPCSMSTTVTQYDVTFPNAPAGSRIAMRHNVGSAACYWFVDDIEVHAAAACQHPVGVAATGVYSNDITIAFAGSISGQYVITISDNANYSDTVSVIGDSSYTFTNLTPLTAYHISVFSDCGGDLSNPVIINVTTTTIPEPLPYSTGFEITDDIAWTLINGTQTNAWYIDSAVNNGGSQALYISNNNGASNAYSTNSTSLVYATKLFAFDSIGDYVVGYDWRAQGESPYFDWLRVFLAPASVEFTAGSEQPLGSGLYSAPTATVPAGWVDLNGHNNSPHTLNLSNSWNTVNVTFTISNPGNYYLVFMWSNDGSGGSNPPAAVDNVQVARLACPAPQNIVIDNVGGSSVDVHWTPAGNESEWLVSVGGTTTTVYTPSANVSNLDNMTAYTVAVRAVCDVGDTSFASTANFTTGVCDSSVISENFDASSSFSSSSYSPVGYSMYNYSYVQTIIPAEQMAANATEITAISFKPASINAGSYFTNMDVYMANVSEDSFVDFLHPDSAHTFVQVISNGNMNYSTIDWQVHAFDNPFTWDGQSNVLVAVRRNHGVWTSGSSFEAHSDSLKRTIYAYRDGSAYHINDAFGGTTSRTVGNLRLIGCASSCITPIVYVSNIIEQSATVTAHGTGLNYELKYGTDDANLGNTMTSTTGVFNLTGLQPATMYYVAVRQQCDTYLYSNWTITTFTTNLLGCIAPTALAVTSIGYNEVSLNWTIGSEETAWEVMVYNAMDTLTVNTSTTGATINGLQPGTAYSAVVRALCGVNNDIEGPWSSAITFTTDACQATTGVTVSAAATTANVSWDDMGSASYRIIWGERPFNPLDAEGEASAIINSYTITGLAPETDYSVVVYNNCAEGLSVPSGTVNFTTEEETEGIDDVVSGTLSLYPNPASTNVTVGLEGFEGMVGVDVVDMNGRVVYKTNTTSTTVTVDVTELSQGAYFVRVVSGTRTAVSKLVVK